MASIRKRNGKYQVQVRVNGFAASRTFAQLSHARLWARDTELKAERSELGDQRYCPKTLAAIVERYLDEVTPKKADPEPERYVLQALLRDPIVSIPLQALSSKDFAQYRDRRLQQVSPSTLKRQMGILRAACRVARDEWDWVSPVDDLRRVSLPCVKLRPIDRISAEDEEKLISAASKLASMTLRDAIVLAMETAMRRSEIVRLRPQDIDFGRELIMLRQTKNGHPRLIPISSRAMGVLRSSGDDDVPPVFKARRDMIKSAFRRVRTSAGLPNVRFHDFRHEAISRLFEKGLTVPEVASISGHRDLSTLMRYAHADLKRAQEKMRAAAA